MYACAYTHTHMHEGTYLIILEKVRKKGWQGCGRCYIKETFSLSETMLPCCGASAKMFWQETCQKRLKD